MGAAAVIERARSVLEADRQAIAEASDALGHRFVDAVGKAIEARP